MTTSKPIQDNLNASNSPFHSGELAVQDRLGVREKTEGIGRRFIREFMPDQHREFYASLPFILVGTLDDQRRPWASILVGEGEFISSPDPVTLTLQAHPLVGDRLGDNLAIGADIGLLGIELETRRRNRVNGKITALHDAGFTVHVSQSFGNCPQFIQKRRLRRVPVRTTHPGQRLSRFTPAIAEIIRHADSFFIATSYGNGLTAQNQGVDVSHRGGKPGFVKLEGDRQFIFPNFSGNNFYNTLGNLWLNPRIGILFVDFATGHLVSITGTAEVIWDSDALTQFKGAQQLIRVTAEEIIDLAKILPLRWDFEEYSPALNFTGAWKTTTEPS